MRTRTFAFLILLVVGVAFVVPTTAHDYVPGKKQTSPILLKGGDLHTVSDGLLTGTDLLFDNGRITAIGKDLDVPANTNIIDISGKQVYPGLIESNSQLGLIEIGAVDATSDRAEKGKNNADVRSRVAYNPDSEIIPTVRSNGVTTALVAPGGQLVRGRSSLMNLDGWTQEDAMEKDDVALHIAWPKANIVTAWWMEKTAKEQKEESAENMEAIYRIFKNARSYKAAKSADPGLKQDLRWEAMLPLFDGQMSLFIHASDRRQIEQAVAFSREFGLRTVIVGGRDAVAVAELLTENEIPVILSYNNGAPGRVDDPFDAAYRAPQFLAQSGVHFSISAGSATGVRNLPFLAGRAIGYGLSAEAALRSVTLSAAEILGAEKELGSLEVGKEATLIISDGDLFDFSGNNVVLEFIQGRSVDLDDKQKELYRKYREKGL